MKQLLGFLAALALSGCLATVRPHSRVQRETTLALALPPVLPAMVLVAPGLTVVGDLDQEIFFADGYYWTRQQHSWFRTRDHHRGWARVDDQHVPPLILRSPPGRYRRFRAETPEHYDQVHGRRAPPEADAR